MNIVFVGNSGGTNVAASLQRAAQRCHLQGHLCDASQAHSSSLMARINWRVRGHRPIGLRRFSRRVLEICKARRPDILLATGLAPICAEDLKEINGTGVDTVNYLTDDPWNPGQRSRWFLRALPVYRRVFSPREANLNDLSAAGCKSVQYLPFGYDEELFYPEKDRPEVKDDFDVVFAGGADSDRIPFIRTLVGQGSRLALIGDYWDRFEETRPYTLGHLGPERLRKITANAKVAVCLVRRANRDGHVMRTFEIPATGTCMLAEDTHEHRMIFGEDRSAVTYFKTPQDLAEKVQYLLAHESERQRLAKEAHRIVTTGHHGYGDRLQEMLRAAG